MSWHARHERSIVAEHLPGGTCPSTHVEHGGLLVYEDQMDTGVTPAEPGTQEPSNARTRWWAIGGVVVVIAFVASVVMSTRSASVPVGASGSMAGMSMGAGRLMVTMRDVSGREVRLPGGRPGVVVFAEARRCKPCMAAVRAARDALREAPAGAQLIVVMTDSGTGRADVRAFARSVGPGPARYVIDDRNGGLSSMLGASSLGSAVVYDARGRVVARPDARLRQMVAALQTVGR